MALQLAKWRRTSFCTGSEVDVTKIQKAPTFRRHPGEKERKSAEFCIGGKILPAGWGVGSIDVGWSSTSVPSLGKVPAQLIHRFAFGIHLGGDDSLMFFKRDDAFFLVVDGRPLPAGNNDGR